MGYNPDEPRDNHGQWTEGGGQLTGDPISDNQIGGHQVHRVLKGGSLSKSPSIPFGKHAAVMSKADAEAHAVNMNGMNPGMTFKAVPVAKPIQDEKALQASASGARRAGAINRYLGQTFIGPRR